MNYLKFQFAILLLIGLCLVSACNEDRDDDNNVPSTNETTIWSGTKITFEKQDDGDPTTADSQDRISDKVWITRGNDGGQIYNAVSETSATKTSSPAGTLWALGTTADLDNLVFDDFRTTVTAPKNVVGQDLVLLLSEENIAIDIKFTIWSSNKGGGFAYERSTN